MTERVSPKAAMSRAIGGAALAVMVATGALAAQQQQTSSAIPPDSNWTAPTSIDTAALKGPVQPIFFRHDIHAGQYQIDCKYCHSYAEISMQPGIPSLKACMGCHLIVSGSGPLVSDSNNAHEIQKLRDAYNNNKPIDWVQVHTLPPFVHFPHMRHVVNAGLTCQECHGQIQTMPRVYKYSSLKMGWCVSCHEQRKVTTDCTACHY